MLKLPMHQTVAFNKSQIPSVHFRATHYVNVNAGRKSQVEDVSFATFEGLNPHPLWVACMKRWGLNPHLKTVLATCDFLLATCSINLV